jgi:uncharacterized protein (TIGR01777 family)
MKILVTGATGFLGKPLCQALLMKGYGLRALVRDPEQAKKKLELPMEFLQWDGTEKGLPETALDEIHAVIHLAGESIAGKRWTDERKKKILDSRVQMEKALISRIHARDGERASRPQVFISGSAIGFYGDRGDEVLDEQSSSGSGILAEVCRQWEAETTSLDILGVRRVNVRTGMVLGRDGGALGSLMPLFRLGLGGPLGNGKQWISWIHLEDWVNALIFLLEKKDATGAFNLVAPHLLTNREFARSLGRALRRPAILTAPAFVMKSVLGEMAELILGSQRVKPARLEQAGFQFRFTTIESAWKDLARGS